MIDVVIPTIPGREDSFARCVESYERNTPDVDLNLIVVRGEGTCGKGWIAGMKQARHPYLHLTCDDIELVSPTWAEACMRTVDRGELPCPVVYEPDRATIESCGGEDGGLHRDLRADGTEVKFTVLPFMSAEQAKAIGMIEAHHKTDVWVSERGRELGWPTVIVRDFEAIHHYEDIGRIDSPRQRRRDSVIFEEARCESL